jgi:hypothetical protein
MKPKMLRNVGLRQLRTLRRIRRLQAFVVLLMGMAISGSSAGQDDPRPIVQRWGIRDTPSHSSIAFHPMTERLLTKHAGGTPTINR